MELGSNSIKYRGGREMEKKIVIINGSGGVGKDTFVEFCRIYANVTNISSVDKVKEAAKILGWNGVKTEVDRQFLSELKSLSSVYNDNPYEYVESNVHKFMNDNSSYLMFIHVREPEEIERIKGNFGCITLLIKNDNVDKIVSNDADANVENYKYDYIIYNDGDLKTLGNKAADFVRLINKGVDQNGFNI